jgi:hypothetical protein
MRAAGVTWGATHRLLQLLAPDLGVGARLARLGHLLLQADELLAQHDRRAVGGARLGVKLRPQRRQALVLGAQRLLQLARRGGELRQLRLGARALRLPRLDRLVERLEARHLGLRLTREGEGAGG